MPLAGRAVPHMRQSRPSTRFDSLEHQAFASVRGVCALPPGHQLVGREVIRPKDLANQPFIALAAEDRARHRLDAILSAEGVQPRIIVETPSSATLCALALNGVGIGITNPAAAEGFDVRGLVFRPFEPAVYFKSIMLFRPDAQKTRLVKDFVSALLGARTSEGKRP